jgi:transposase-like protein
MSKIPQGEWSAIAARYQNGESISKIARSYGCTPPAIHYILKRNRQRPGEAAAPVEPARNLEGAQPRLVRMHAVEPVPVPASVAEPANGVATAQFLRTSSAAALAPAIRSDPAPPLRAAPTVMPLRPAETQPVLNPERAVAAGGNGLPGLTNELHGRVEAAIDLFRTSFNAALADGSADVRERLRQAATDLMRVAARTTIVLDRANANAERAARSHNYPRSAHAADDLGKLG